jgi:hypothetical protein
MMTVIALQEEPSDEEEEQVSAHHALKQKGNKTKMTES